MEVLITNASIIGDGLTYTCQYPALAVGKDGKTYVAWQEAHEDETENIFFACYDNNIVNESEKIRISGNGLALMPRIISVGDTFYLAWTECENKEWSICVCSVKDRKRSDIVVVAKAEALFYPRIRFVGGKLMVLYTEEDTGKSCIKASWFSKDLSAVSSEFVTCERCVKRYRADAAEDRNGNIVVVYDGYNGDNYDAYVKVLSNGKWSDEIQVSEVNDRRATFPVIGFDGRQFNICYQETAAGSYMNYTFVEGYVENGSFVRTNIEIITKNFDWCNYFDLASASDGSLVFFYNVGKENMYMRYRFPGQSWSAPITVSGSTLGRTPTRTAAMRPAVMIDENHRVHFSVQFANANGHKLRMSTVKVYSFDLKDVEGIDNTELEMRENIFCLPIPAEKKLDKVDEEKKVRWLKAHGISGNILFGDIHGQSIMSDGMGELDQYYHYAINQADLDFSALTDHDCYPDVATWSEWEWNRTMRNLFDREKNFTVLLAFEWTSNEYKHDFGHKNVYYPGSEGGLYTCVDKRSLDPTRLYATIAKDGGFCIPHHPAADWGMLSAATDWDYFDPVVQPAAEIFSRHANYEKTEDLSKYTKNIAKFPRKCIQDALKRGYRFSFVAGSDSHELEHGIEGGILGAFMEEQTSQCLWDAINDHNTYATTGARILMTFDINGTRMGHSLKTKGERKLSFGVYAVAPIKKVEVIKNCEVVATFNPTELACDFTWTDKGSSFTDYYYIRVEQEDEHIAWASPIWVN